MGGVLSDPNTEKNSSDGSNNRLISGACAIQGWRDEMEDAYISYPDFDQNVSLFGVFDGHSGASVALYCKRYFAAELKKNKNYQTENYEEALKETFLRMDEILGTGEGQEELKTLEDEHHMNHGLTTGTTANVCLVVGMRVYCANVGNSRSFVWSQGQVVELSRNQSLRESAERARVENAGGFVSDQRINNMLNVSRAIGHLSYNANPELQPYEQLVSVEPDITIRDIGSEDLFMVMGSAGFFQTLKADEICGILERNFEEDPDVKLSRSLEMLFDMSLGEKTAGGGVGNIGCENMTGIVVRFKK